MFSIQPGVREVFVRNFCWIPKEDREGSNLSSRNIVKSLRRIRETELPEVTAGGRVACRLNETIIASQKPSES